MVLLHLFTSSHQGVILAVLILTCLAWQSAQAAPSPSFFRKTKDKKEGSHLSVVDNTGQTKIQVQSGLTWIKMDQTRETKYHITSDNADVHVNYPGTASPFGHGHHSDQHGHQQDHQGDH